MNEVVEIAAPVDDTKLNLDEISRNMVLLTDGQLGKYTKQALRCQELALYDPMSKCWYFPNGVTMTGAFVNALAIPTPEPVLCQITTDVNGKNQLTLVKK